MEYNPHYYKTEIVERAEREDTFLTAFGNKPGADRRKQRRQRKGWNT